MYVLGGRLQAVGEQRVNLRTSVSVLEFVLNLIHTEIKRRLVGLRFPWQGTVASGTPASSPPPNSGSWLPMPGELGLRAGWPLGWPGLLAGGRAIRICCPFNPHQDRMRHSEWRHWAGGLVLAGPFRIGTPRTRTLPAPTWATPVPPPPICHLAALGGRCDRMLRGVAPVSKHLHDSLRPGPQRGMGVPRLSLFAIGSFLLSVGLGWGLCRAAAGSQWGGPSAAWDLIQDNLVSGSLF